MNNEKNRPRRIRRHRRGMPLIAVAAPFFAAVWAWNETDTEA